MGKTSLINYVLGSMHQAGYQTVLIDVRQADADALKDLDSFLRWFCWSIGQQLNWDGSLDDHWPESAGSKLNCTTYMQEQILAQMDAPLIVALDTMHYLMEHPYIANTFFAMVRSWYEQARVRPQWQKLRLILAHVAELDSTPASPSIAVSCRATAGPALPDPKADSSAESRPYSYKEVSVGEATSLQALVDLVGGHPYLLQLAFYWLQSEKLTLKQLIQTASTNQGIYREYFVPSLVNVTARR